MPPEWMWSLPDSLDEWFEEVDRRREEKYGTNKSSDEDGSLMMSNDWAEEKRKR